MCFFPGWCIWLSNVFHMFFVITKIINFGRLSFFKITTKWRLITNWELVYGLTGRYVVKILHFSGILRQEVALHKLRLWLSVPFWCEITLRCKLKPFSQNIIWKGYRESEYYASAVADLGEGPGGAARPLLLDQTEARRAEKFLFKTGPPLYLRVWMTGPHPYLKVWIRHCSRHVFAFSLS